MELNIFTTYLYDPGPYFAVKKLIFLYFTKKTFWIIQILYCT